MGMSVRMEARASLMEFFPTVCVPTALLARTAPQVSDFQNYEHIEMF